MGKEKGELIAEDSSRMVTTTVKEISQSGVKLSINVQGQMSGRYNAGQMGTMDVLMKPDGSNEWEGRVVQTTDQGEFIAITGSGKGRASGPTTFSFDGELRFMTQSPRLSWLNGIEGWVEGTGDNAKGEFHGKVYTTK